MCKRYVGKSKKGNQWPSHKIEDWLLWRTVGTEKFPVLAWVTDFQELEYLLSRRITRL